MLIEITDVDYDGDDEDADQIWINTDHILYIKPEVEYEENNHKKITSYEVTMANEFTFNVNRSDKNRLRTGAR
jgi:hypothetical protein